MVPMAGAIREDVPSLHFSFCFLPISFDNFESFCFVLFLTFCLLTNLQGVLLTSLSFSAFAFAVLSSACQLDHCCYFRFSQVFPQAAFDFKDTC